MIHNSFRRIALAQGLLPSRPYLIDPAEAESQRDIAGEAHGFPGRRPEPASSHQAEGATQA